MTTQPGDYLYDDEEDREHAALGEEPALEWEDGEEKDA